MLAYTRAALLAASALLIAPRAAAAGWQEMHQTGGDVRIEVGPDGVASVEHRVRYRVVAGRYDSFDLVGVDPRGEPAPEAVLAPEEGGGPEKSRGDVLARVETVPNAPGTLRILVDEAKGLGRGVYVVDVKYKLDLVATKMLTRDGAMWKLAWTAPPAREGQDGARVVFDLPAAPTEPRLAAPAESTTTLATLRRGKDRDELELVRAHVPRGEAATWSARVDPRAFPSVSSPELRPPAKERAPRAGLASLAGTNALLAIGAAGFAALAGALAALLRSKQGAVRAAAAVRGARARPLLPVPWGMGPYAYGSSLALGFAALLWSSPTIGALLVALAAALAAHRAPALVVRPRGPGVWRPVSDPSALLAGPMPSLPTDAFDVVTVRGRVALGGVALAIALVAWALREHVPQISIALPLAAAALVPIFTTGTRAQLPPTPTELAARVLRPARDALAAAVDLSQVDIGAIGRDVGAARAPRTIVEKDASVARLDEVRLACVPRDRTPGLRAIELALGVSPAGYSVFPEVLVRFDDGSAAAERVATIARGTPVVPGRTPEEKVVRLVPEVPTASAAATLVAGLLLSLEGRRVTDRKEGPPTTTVRWAGEERRRVVPRRGAVSPPLVALC